MWPLQSTKRNMLHRLHRHDQESNNHDQSQGHRHDHYQCQTHRHDRASSVKHIGHDLLRLSNTSAWWRSAVKHIGIIRRRTIMTGSQAHRHDHEREASTPALYESSTSVWSGRLSNSYLFTRLKYYMFCPLPRIRVMVG